MKLVRQIFFLAGFLSLMLVSSASALSPSEQKAELLFGSGGRITSILADGSGRHTVTDPVIPESDYYGETGDSTPRVSPDGQRIVFSRYTENAGFESTSSIIVADRNGGSESVVTTSSDEDKSGYAPAWSADGSMIYLITYAEKGRRIIGEISEIRPDGSGKRVLSRSTLTLKRKSFEGSIFLPFDLAPSPTGSQLLVTYFPIFGSKSSRTYLMNPDTGKRELLMRDASGGTWSPDGLKIAFESSRARIGKSCYEGRCSFDTHLYLMDSYGSGVKKLIPGKPIGSQFAPDWSADGERIAFLGNRTASGLSGSTEIFTVAPDGDCLTRLTNGTPSSSYPEWVPNPGRSSRPATCGDAAPDPLVDVPIPAQVTDLKLTPLFAGNAVGNRLLTDVFKDGRGVNFSYNACSAFHYSDCSPAAQVNSAPVCEEQNSSAFYSGTFTGLRKYKGGLLMQTKPTDRYGMETFFYSGGIETAIYTRVEHRGRKVTRADHRKILDQLRPVTSPDESKPTFLPAVFTRRQVDRAKATLERSESQKVTGRTNRAYLKFGRALDRIGDFQVTKCKRFGNIGAPHPSGNESAGYTGTFIGRHGLVR